MIARCPASDLHLEFRTTAHVMEEWVVDEEGEYIKVLEEGIEVTQWPDPDNMWYCYICGEEANVS